MGAQLTAAINSEHKNPSIDALWIGLTLFVIVSIAVLLPIYPNDYWWYLRLGEDIISTGGVPGVETYSFTQVGTPVVYPSWLSAVIFWFLFETGGLTLTVLTRGLLVASFYLFVWLACRQVGANAILASALTLLAALAGSNNWVMRPQLFAYPLFGLALWLMFRKSGVDKLTWLLVPIAVAWINLHGSFVLLFLILGAAIVGGRGDRKALGLIFAGAFLATLINPRGILAWSDAVMTINEVSNQQFSVEWRPPTNDGWQANIFFGWILVFSLLIAFSRRILSASDWLWFFGFGWMALSGVRYVIWFLAILAILSSKLLAPVVARYLTFQRNNVHAAINYAVAGSVLLLPLLTLPGVREQWWVNSPPVLSSNTPVEATEWLSEHPELPGAMWSNFAFASYLIYHLPERPVWIDTRFYPYAPEQWERYIEVSEAAPDWEAVLEEEGINLLVLDLQAEPRLVTAVEDSPGWCRKYRDEVAVIYMRAALEAGCK